jgi:hypothetical protein
VVTDNSPVSVAVAETSLLPAVRAAADDTVVLADGFSCRTQLDQLAGRTGIHLAQLLAAAGTGGTRSTGGTGGTGGTVEHHPSKAEPQ